MRPPVLRWLGRGILVPLQAEISGSDPKMIYTITCSRIMIIAARIRKGEDYYGSTDSKSSK